jgi:hypothetical protein
MNCRWLLPELQSVALDWGQYVETTNEIACNYLNVRNAPKIEILTMPAMQLSTINEEVEKLFVLQRQAMTKERWRISKSKVRRKDGGSDWSGQ